MVKPTIVFKLKHNYLPITKPITMKSTFTFLFMLLSIAAIAASNDSTNFSYVKHSQPTVITYDDSTGIMIGNIGTGILGGESAIGAKKTEAGIILFFGRFDENDKLKGITFSEDGRSIIIDASSVVIVRKSFTSHADADTALQPGEEYYLIGDRIVYRKP